MVKTRSTLVFPLLTLENRVKKNDKFKPVGLHEDEKKRLLRAIKPMNFQFADRVHAENYATALECKIRLINGFTNNGVDIFQSKIKFPLDFVYPMLLDFYHLAKDYTSIKDKYLYSKHMEESDYYKIQPEPKLDCEDCTFYSWVKDIEIKRLQTCEVGTRKKNYGTHLYNKG